MAEPVLAFDAARIAYRARAGEVVVIPGMTLALEPGEALGLVGESGCGKSTLAYAAMGHLGATGRVVSGAIRFEGQDIAKLAPRALARLRGDRMAMVYQDPMSSLNPVMRIGRQLMEVPMRHRKMAPEAARARAVAMLREVELADPEGLMNRYPHELSGGQQQRVVIAMALIGEPALLILDEPTTGLDVTVEAAVLDLIARLRQRHGVALLLISHDLGVLARICERVGVIYAGELVEEGPLDTLFADPRHPYSRALMACLPRSGGHRRAAPLVAIPGRMLAPALRPRGCAFAPRCGFARGDLCAVRPIPLVGAGPRRRVRCVRHRELEPGGARAPAGEVSAGRAEPGAVLVEAEGLRKVYRASAGLVQAPRAVPALDGATLRIRAGETLGLVGESGCGKTTLARILAGLETASEGSLRIEGVALAETPVARRPADLVRALQMVFQNPDATLNPSHSVGYALARPLKRLRGLRGRARREAVARLLERVRLPAAYAARKPGQLSGGERQRVAIARAIAASPRLLVADEPASALDVSVQAAIVNLLAELQDAGGMALLFISHDLALVRYLADSLAVMYRGRVVESGPRAAVFARPSHPYTEALLSAASGLDPAGAPARVRLAGAPSDAPANPRGCPFAPRCPRRLGPACDSEPPPLLEAAPGHVIACHIPLDALARPATPGEGADG